MIWLQLINLLVSVALFVLVLTVRLPEDTNLLASLRYRGRKRVKPIHHDPAKGDMVPVTVTVDGRTVGYYQTRGESLPNEPFLATYQKEATAETYGDSYYMEGPTGVTIRVPGNTFREKYEEASVGMRVSHNNVQARQGRVTLGKESSPTIPWKLPTPEEEDEGRKLAEEYGLVDP